MRGVLTGIPRTTGQICRRCASGWPSPGRGDRSGHIGTFTGPAGTCQQRTELTTRQRELLRTLKLPEPARFTRLDPAAAPVAAT